MTEQIQIILKHLVDYPEAVSVHEDLVGDGVINIVVSVHQSDMGKVIGKGGKIIRALRNLVHILAVKKNLRVFLVLNEQTD